MRKSVTEVQGNCSHALIFCFFQSLPYFPLSFLITSSSPSVLQIFLYSLIFPTSLSLILVSGYLLLSQKTIYYPIHKGASSALLCCTYSQLISRHIQAINNSVNIFQALINMPYSLLPKKKKKKSAFLDVLQLYLMENIPSSTYTGIHWHLFTHQQVAKTVCGCLVRRFIIYFCISKVSIVTDSISLASSFKMII